MSLIAAYAFNEGAGFTAAEVDGGTSLAGIPGWAAGRHGSSLRMNGSAGPILDPFSAASAFTIMFDVYLDGPGGGGYNVIINDWELESALGNIQIANSSGALEWYKGPTISGATIPTGEWHHVAFVASGTQRRALLDGAQVGSMASTELIGVSGVALGGFSGFYPNMRLDNLRVYDTALSNAEIAAVAGTPVEPSGPPNVLPTANAGADLSVVAGQQVVLNGIGSVDPDGSIISYVWTQTTGPAVNLSGSGASRIFTPASQGTYAFRLTVTDDRGGTAQDNVTVTVARATDGESGATGGYVRHRDRMVQESVIEDLTDTLIACRWLAGTTSRPVINPNNPSGWEIITTTEEQVLRLAGRNEDGSPVQVRVIDYFPEADATESGSSRTTPPNTLAVDSGVPGESSLVEMGSSMREQPYLFTMAFYARSDAVALAMLNDLRDRYAGRLVRDDNLSLYNYNATDFDASTPPVTRMEIDAFRYAKNSSDVATPADVHLYFAELQLTDFVDS